MKARKAMALAMTAAMVGGLMTVPVMAEENAELLPGGGSKIIYCITPSTSNPFFNTEQVIAKEKAEELGYEVKCASHDDDAATQLHSLSFSKQLSTMAQQQSFAITLVQMLPSKQFRKHMTLESRLSLSTVKSTSPDLQ